MSRAPIELVRAQLIARVTELADQLAPDLARVEGYRRWSLNPVRADSAPDSFVIDVSGPTTGRWYEFAGAFGGDLLDLIGYVKIAPGDAQAYKTRETRGEAIAWARAFLGLEDLSPDFRARLDREAQAAQERRAQQEHESRQRREAQIKRARDRWFKLGRIIGTPAERYLERARQIALGEIGSPLNALRFCPDRIAPETGEIFDAMQAAMTNAKGEVRAIHTTFLAEGGAGKADMERAKRVFGQPRGAMIRLSRGASGLSEAEAVKRGRMAEVLAVSEGIEDALCWSMIQPAHRTAAAYSLDNIAHIPLPDCVRQIIVLADNDPKGSAASGALARVVERLRARAGDRAVLIQRPPEHFKDLNDWWRSM